MIKTVFSCISFISFICFVSNASFASDPEMNQNFISFNEPWKNHRDYNVVKQMLDTSCGAASVANILQNFYHDEINEFQVLDAMRISKPTYSFSDLKVGVEKLGYRGVSFSTTYEGMQQLKIPIIVHFNAVTDGHFVVLRTITDNFVLVADPAFGNTRYSRHQFEKMWASSDDYGRAFAILPNNNRVHKGAKNYFNAKIDKLTNFYYVGK